jgi:DNA polymerase-4
VRNIVHLDVPDFCATLEELRRPELKRRPLVLAEPGPRAVVQGVNDAARTEGIREGMPLIQARRSCRRLLTVPLDPSFYKEQHGRILDELGHFSPLVEGIIPGHYFVDLTGTRRLWGPESDVARRMERRLADGKGLPARAGVASNKLVSQVAAHGITAGDLGIIFPGGEASFLDPLPVDTLPGVGFKTAARLADFNIQRIGQLAGLSPESLFGVFGKMGSRLLRIAKGVDPTPVLPFQKTPKLTVARDLDRDEIDRDRLEAVLFQEVEEAGWLLRCHNRYPGKLALEIRHADGVTVRSQHAVCPITSHVDLRLFRAARSAFRRMFQRRVAVRRIVLELSEFSMPLRQMSLFPWEEASLQADQKLQKALDAIRHRFGRGAISWGRVQ